MSSADLDYLSGIGGIKRLASRTVVVTGAAGGIGRAAALRCAAEGANIVAVDCDAHALRSLVSEVNQLGSDCSMVEGDISDLATVESMMSVAETAFGRLDGLVNNAATSGKLSPFETAEPEEFARMIAVNVQPVWRSMQLARAPMARRKGGAIVNIASLAALRAERGVALYGMTKGAVANLTINAALDYASANIRVNAVCPGPVETPMLGKMEKIIDASNTEAARKKIASTIPLRRCATVWEIAGAVAFLLSDDASFITGVLLPVDGGKSVKQ
ncbi:MAG: glucose 1-dehydrogenase [Pseudomonadota bacterium]